MRKFLVWVVGLIATAIMFAAQIPLHEAKSNISTYVSPIIEDPPDWLTAPSTDWWVTAMAVLTLAALIISWVWSRVPSYFALLLRPGGQLHKCYQEGMQIREQIKAKNPAGHMMQGYDDGTYRAFDENVGHRIDKWTGNSKRILEKAENWKAAREFTRHNVRNANEFSQRLATLKLILQRDYGVVTPSWNTNKSAESYQPKPNLRVSFTTGGQRKIGDYQVLFSMDLYNDSPYEIQCGVEIDQLSVSVPPNMLLPVFLETINQIKGNEPSGSFSLHSKKNVNVPLLFRNPNRRADWYFIEKKNTYHYIPAGKLGVVLSVQEDASVRKLLVRVVEVRSDFQPVFKTNGVPSDFDIHNDPWPEVSRP